MSLPQTFRDRLALPAIAAPMFLVSGPDLVVEACRAGVIGTFPSLNRRTTEEYAAWLDEIEGRLADTQRRAVRRQSDCAQEQPARLRRSRGDGQASRAACDHVARRKHRSCRRRAWLRRARVSRRDQHASCPQGGGSRRRRIDRGLRRRRRPRRHDEPVRARVGNPRLLRQDHHSLRRDLDWPTGRGGDHDGRGPRLSRHALHRDTRKPRQGRLQGDDRLGARRRHRLHPRDQRGARQLSGAEPDRGGPRSANLPTKTDGYKTGEKRAWKDVWSAGHGVGVIDDVPTVAELCARLVEEYDEACASLTSKRSSPVRAARSA